MEETTVTKRQRLTISIGTLTSPSPLLSSSSNTPAAPRVTSLPFELVEEILCRLPIKFLLQLRCVCKFWNSLISHDLKFARKHLRMSNPRQQLVLIPHSREINVISYPLHSVFTTVTTDTTKLEYPPLINQNYLYHFIGSCDGLLCFAIDQHLALLWNPCIKKFKILPYLKNPQEDGNTIYGFGYDPFTNNYKVVAIFCYNYQCDSSGAKVLKTQVKVHTLGTDSWRSIQESPSMVPIDESGKFVSGTVNWLASSRFIISLDLGKESYQEILQPNYECYVELTSGVLRDCLCIFSHTDSFTDVWLMKEYKNKESWTKLIRLPYVGDHGFFYANTNVVYISEDDHVLLMFKELFKLKFVVYDSRNDILKSPGIQDFKFRIVPNVYVESLISPCF